MSLILRELNENDEQAFLAGYEEYKSDRLDWYTFIWKPGMSHQEHLQKLKNQKQSETIPPGRVPGTMLYAFVNEKIVGRVSIRHELNDFLFKRGGHIGYSVSPFERKKGYATEMLKLTLVYCRTNLGLKKVLITCDDDNIPSWKIIEKCGGKLENKTADEKDGTLFRRYWIDL
jgi:predicted acetyltransferase